MEGAKWDECCEDLRGARAAVSALLHERMVKELVSYLQPAACSNFHYHCKLPRMPSPTAVLLSGIRARS